MYVIVHSADGVEGSSFIANDAADEFVKPRLEVRSDIGLPLFRGIDDVKQDLRECAGIEPSLRNVSRSPLRGGIAWLLTTGCARGYNRALLRSVDIELERQSAVDTRRAAIASSRSRITILLSTIY
jgi:hypothetical protein